MLSNVYTIKDFTAECASGWLIWRCTEPQTIKENCQQYIYHIFGHAAQSPFFSTEFCVFHKLLFFVHKIFMFYIKDALKFTCPALQPKGLGIQYWLQNPGFRSPLPAPLLQPTGVKLSVPNSGCFSIRGSRFSRGRIYIFII
jgi:hypothetical protein